MPTGFQLGSTFPHEGFVQAAVEQFFLRQGFIAIPRGHADFACRHPDTNEEWLIEAKGKTKEVGLDFRTGLGQLVQRMHGSELKYGLAFPNIPTFLNQYKLVSPWVRSQIQLHWLVVGEQGHITIIAPSDAIK
ncbi:hypothetical protein F8S13_24160 [Chloroflexia bacterium SDU3-3]|nr:hypothetical protein F8S13_24160 [Chloroflexia bacterium SDU3-3]